MGKKAQYDLTSGGILRKLLFISVPIMAVQFMQMAYNLTDIFWLGRIGPDAVAASGTAGLFMWLSSSLMLIGKVGSEIGVSQAFGRGDKKDGLRYAQNALLLSAFIGIIFALVLILLNRPFIGFFQLQNAAVEHKARQYLMIVAISIPFSCATGVFTGSFNASGNSRTPFFISGIGLVLNMALDPLFILYLGWGVEGAAIATTAAQAVVFILFFVAMKCFRNRPFETFKVRQKPDKGIIRQILIWTIPISLESMLFCMLSMITSRFEASFGTNAIAVSRVGNQIESLSWLISGGFSSALISFVGQNFGAGKKDRIQRALKVAVLLMTVWGMLVMLILIGPGGTIFSLFMPDPSLSELGMTYMRIIAISQIPLCLEAVYGGVFKGRGQSVPPALISIITNALRVFIAYFMSQTSLGLYGIWIVIALSAVVRVGWAMIWYYTAERKKSKEDQLKQKSITD